LLRTWRDASVARPALLADIRPLRESPDYRRLWIGSALSAVGTKMTTFAVALQVFQLSHSSAAVGVVGLAYAVPAIAVGLVGGVLIDSVDRRTLVLITTCVQALVSLAFAAQAFAGAGALWLLYALTAVQAAVGALSTPARRTFMPRLLPRELMPAGAALTMIAMYVAMISGPALAGILATGGGLKLCYLTDVVTFAAAFYGVFRLPSMRPEGKGSGRNLSAVLDGLSFIIDNRALRGALLADVSATVLAMPIALFPALNAERFGGSPTTLGLLSTAIAVGGLLGSILSGPVKHVVHPGRAMLITGAIWGAALAGFGVVHSLSASLTFLAVAGAADVLSVVFRTTIVQLATPDSMRGRVSSTEFVVGAAFPELGNFRAGLIAGPTAPAFSAVIGGIAAVVGTGLIALTSPTFLRYRHTSAAGEPTTSGRAVDVALSARSPKRARRDR
jgi:MFS family permease